MVFGSISGHHTGEDTSRWMWNNVKTILGNYLDILDLWFLEEARVVLCGGGGWRRGSTQSPPGPATVNMWPRTSLLLLLLGTLASHALDVDQGYTDEEADAVVIEGRSLAAAGHAAQPLNQPAFCKILWH